MHIEMSPANIAKQVFFYHACQGYPIKVVSCWHYVLVWLLICLFALCMIPKNLIKSLSGALTPSPGQMLLSKSKHITLAVSISIVETTHCTLILKWKDCKCAIAMLACYSLLVRSSQFLTGGQGKLLHSMFMCC